MWSTDKTLKSFVEKSDEHIIRSSNNGQGKKNNHDKQATEVTENPTLPKAHYMMAKKCSHIIRKTSQLKIVLLLIFIVSNIIVFSVWLILPHFTAKWLPGLSKMPTAAGSGNTLARKLTTVAIINSVLSPAAAIAILR